jgi:hypothetical protein
VARAESGVPGTASPSVSAAEKQGRRIAAEADQTISIPKDKEGGLAVAAKAMLQQARKLAATARAVAVENVSWRQARQLDVLQRASSRMTGKSGRTMHSERGLWARQANKRHRLNKRKVASAMLLEWSTLSEARLKELFERAHPFSNDHPGVWQS